jgi:hypothetical protein
VLSRTHNALSGVPLHGREDCDNPHRAADMRAWDYSGRYGHVVMSRVSAHSVRLMFGVVGTTLAIGLASGCDDGQSAKARAPFSELFFARPAHGWGPFASERSSNCAQSGPCSRARAMASNKYACGESQLAVETLTHAPITPSSGFDTEAAPVTVRGHPGHLAKFDAADFELIWQETPDVGVRMWAEDVSHSTPEILALAGRLSVRRWREDASRTRPSSSSCEPLGDFR